MSTYLSNSPTYLPTIQPFQPDMQLYAGTLEMKQTKFDQAAKQISSLYGSLLNAPMLRDKNIATRDEFFKSIDYEIKKVANLDLSLQENVNQATQLFTSLYDDKNIVKDMMWTKNFYNQRERGESFRNCFDPEKCGGEFWQGGLDVLDYRAQEFKAASDDEAMSFGDVKYVPYINVMAEAQKVAEKNGIGQMTIDTPLGNGYIMQTTNGPDIAAGPLMSIFTERFKNDPKLQEYYKAVAYLERKNWVASNAQNYGGSYEAAEQAYVTERKQAIEELYAPEKDKTTFAKDVQSQKKKELEERIRKEGTTGDDDLAAEYLKTLESERTLTDADKQLEESLNAAVGSSRMPKRNLAGEAIDASWASALFNLDVKKAAIAESWRDYKVLYKEDTVWLRKQQMANDRYIAELKKKEEKEEEVNDDFFSTSGISIADGSSAGPGATVIDLSETAAGNVISKETKEAEEQFEGVNRTINTRLYSSTLASANNGDAQSSLDLVNQVDLLFNEYSSWANKKGASGEKTDAANKLTDWNRKSMKEKLSWAKSGGYDYIFKKLDESSQHKMYKNLYGPMANSAINNKESRPYLNQTVKSLYPDLQQASNAMVVKNSWQDITKSLYTGSINKITATGDDSPINQFLPYTVGEKGFRSANQFAVAYAFDKGGVKKITPYETPGATGLPSWMESMLDPTGQAKKNMQRKTVEYEVVGKDGNTRKEKRYADNGQLVVPNQLSYAKNMYWATGDQVLKTQPKIKFTDEAGKAKSVYAGQFFNDEYDIVPEYAQYADKFQFERKDGKQTAFERNFRDAKWAWAFGDKSDAWVKRDDGTWAPDPYSERTTMFGRGISNLFTGGPAAMWEGISMGYGEGLVSGEAARRSGTNEYFDKFTNYNVDIDEYYGEDWEGKKPLMHYEIEREMGNVEVPGGSIFGDLVNMGSFGAKAINGVFDLSDKKNAMSNKYNIGFWQYIKASQAGGIGNDAGQSMIMAGNIQKNAIHSEADAQIFNDLITLSTQRQSKDKTSLAINYSYVNLALGKEDWQGMIVKPALKAGENDPSLGIIRQVVASRLGKKTDSQEVTDYLNKIVNEGITLYQPEAVAEKYNPTSKTESQLGEMGGHYFYNTTKRRALEKVIAITGQVQVPGYEDIGDLRIIREGMNYKVVGQIQTGFDAQTGKKKMWNAEAGSPIIFDGNTPLHEIMYQYPIPGSNGRIYAGLNGYLANARQDLIASGTYQSPNKVYDPSYVPQMWMQKFGQIEQKPEKKDPYVGTQSQLSSTASSFVPMGTNFL